MSLNCNIHTGNAGMVILLKPGGGGGSGRRVAMARKAASASGCAKVGSLQRKVGKSRCSLHHENLAQYTELENPSIIA
jgi:hypothetical protein